MKRSVRRSIWLETVILAGLAIAVTGCSAGLGLLAFDEWRDWFDDEDPQSYRVHLDGYEIGATPSATGLLNVAGARERDYLVSVSRYPLKRAGVHVVAHIQPGQLLNLRNSNPFEGAVITGKVRRDSALGAFMGGVRVVAIKDGAALRANSTTPLEIPPVQQNFEYTIDYTTAAGDYRLGPAKYGDWLVVAVAAGRIADVKHVTVSSTVSATANLVLEEDPGAQTGSVLGAISSKAGVPLATPLITAALGTPYEPAIRAEGRAQVQTASGQTMPEDAWFAFGTLTALGATSGQYQLDLPVGEHDVEAYKFPWHAESERITVNDGGATTVNLQLASAG